MKVNNANGLQVYTKVTSCQLSLFKSSQWWMSMDSKDQYKVSNANLKSAMLIQGQQSYVQGH